MKVHLKTIRKMEKVFLHKIKGEYHYNNGDEYDGKFREDNKNGGGILKYSNGEKYEGEFEDDKKNGKGKIYIIIGNFFFINGDIYDGQYKNDMRHGNGKGIYNI